MAGGCAWQGGACLAGGHAWQGACVAGGVHGIRSMILLESILVEIMSVKRHRDSQPQFKIFLDVS